MQHCACILLFLVTSFFLATGSTLTSSGPSLIESFSCEVGDQCPSTFRTNSCCFNGVSSYLVECDSWFVIITRRASNCFHTALSPSSAPSFSVEENGGGRRAAEMTEDPIDLSIGAYVGIVTGGIFGLAFILGALSGLSAGAWVRPDEFALCSVNWCRDCAGGGDGGCGGGGCHFGGGCDCGEGIILLPCILVGLFILVALLFALAVILASVFFLGYCVGYAFIFLVMVILRVDPKRQESSAVFIVILVVFFSPVVVILAPIWMPTVWGIRRCVEGPPPPAVPDLDDLPLENLQIDEEEPDGDGVGAHEEEVHIQVVLPAKVPGRDLWKEWEERNAIAKNEARAEKLLASAKAFYERKMIPECMNALKGLKATGKKEAEFLSLLEAVSAFGETLIRRANGFFDTKEYDQAKALYVQVSSLSPRIAKSVQERIALCEQLSVTEGEGLAPVRVIRYGIEDSPQSASDPGELPFLQIDEVAVGIAQEEDAGPEGELVEEQGGSERLLCCIPHCTLDGGTLTIQTMGTCQHPDCQLAFHKKHSHKFGETVLRRRFCPNHEEENEEVVAEARAERLLSAAIAFYEQEKISECMNVLKGLKATGRKKSELVSLLKKVSVFGETLIRRAACFVDAREYLKAKDLYVQAASLSPRVGKIVQERIAFCDSQLNAATDSEDEEIEGGEEEGIEGWSEEDFDEAVEGGLEGDEEGESFRETESESEVSELKKTALVEEAEAEKLLIVATYMYEQENIPECMNALRCLKATGMKKEEMFSLLKEVSEFGETLILRADSFVDAREYLKAKDLYAQVSSLSPRVAKTVQERIAFCDLQLKADSEEGKGLEGREDVDEEVSEECEEEGEPFCCTESFEAEPEVSEGELEADREGNFFGEEEDRNEDARPQLQEQPPQPPQDLSDSQLFSLLGVGAESDPIEL